jgi:hypothetical protein
LLEVAILELVVFATSLKFFFIEGGEQFIVGAQTAKTIGLKPTLKITLAGVSFAAILFFLLGSGSTTPLYLDKITVNF